MTGQPPVVIKPEQGKKLTGALGGYGWRILTHQYSSKLVMGIIYVDPGKSPHRWHTHDKPDSAADFTVSYPEGFEEAFVVVQGKGVLQWKENGQVKERRFETGDCIYCPAGVVEHQLFNDQESPMTVVYAATPPMV
jgi:mannose-6-phosphate isomerase-like protein (cupin superfamily)